MLSKYWFIAIPPSPIRTGPARIDTDASAGRDSMAHLFDLPSHRRRFSSWTTTNAAVRRSVRRVLYRPRFCNRNHKPRKGKLHMPGTSTLHDAFIDELRDVYDAEKQLAKALPKMAKAASSSDLRAAFESHLEETLGHAS